MKHCALNWVKQSNLNLAFAMHKKWSFPWRICSLNVTKSSVSFSQENFIFCVVFGTVRFNVLKYITEISLRSFKMKLEKAVFRVLQKGCSENFCDIYGRYTCIGSAYEHSKTKYCENMQNSGMPDLFPQQVGKTGPVTAYLLLVCINRSS